MVKTQEQITAEIVAQAAEATAKAVAHSAQAAAQILAKESSASLTAIAVLQTEMTILKNQQSSFENEVNHKLDNLSPKFEKIYTKLDGRPTWIVASLLAVLFSLCSGLIMYIVTN